MMQPIHFSTTPHAHPHSDAGLHNFLFQPVLLWLTLALIAAVGIFTFYRWSTAYISGRASRENVS